MTVCHTVHLCLPLLLYLQRHSSLADAPSAVGIFSVEWFSLMHQISSDFCCLQITHKNLSVYCMLTHAVRLPRSDHSCLRFRPLCSSVVHVLSACIYLLTYLYVWFAVIWQRWLCVCVCVCVWHSVTLVSLAEVTTWRMLRTPTTSGTATTTQAARCVHSLTCSACVFHAVCNCITFISIVTGCQLL